MTKCGQKEDPCSGDGLEANKVVDVHRKGGPRGVSFLSEIGAIAHSAHFGPYAP